MIKEGTWMKTCGLHPDHTKVVNHLCKEYTLPGEGGELVCTYNPKTTMRVIDVQIVTLYPEGGQTKDQRPELGLMIKTFSQRFKAAAGWVPVSM